MANWQKIKAEYIQDKGTLKELAKKHGVSFSTIQKVAAEEKWKILKKKSEDLVERQVIESVVRKKSEEIASIDAAADKLIERIFEMIADKESPLTPQAIKSLTSALEDLKKTKGIKSKKDQEEQDMRIAKLRKEAGIDEGEEGGGVIVLPEADAPLIDPAEDTDE